MPRHFPVFARVAAACAVVLSPTPFLPGQLPPGHLLVAGFAYPGGLPGLGGLFFVDPSTTPATVTTVTGLPCELTGACTSPTTPWTGSDIVLRLPTTQQVLMNGPVWLHTMVNAYVITLNGSAATTVAVYPLATFTNINGLDNPGAALLADERILLSIDPGSMTAPGPLAGAFLGILDPTLPVAHPNAVVPVPVSPIPAGVPNSLAVDRDLGMAYVGMTNGRIYRIPVPSGGTPVQVAIVPGVTTAMFVEPDGNLLVSGLINNQGGRLWRANVTTGLVTTVTSNMGVPGANAMWMDVVSGDITFGQCDSVAMQSPLRQINAQGVITNLTTGPASGWGCISAIDGWSRIETFGGATGSSPVARWTLAPNPGGAVLLGNTAFTLTNQPPPGAVLSMWAIGWGRTTPPVVLPTVPSTTLLVQSIANAFLLPPQGAFPLPLPANQAFAGVEIYFQCWHWDGATALSASSGLHLTL